MSSTHNVALSKGTILGLSGGLTGTIAMQLFGAGIFTLLRWPTNTSFLIIGNSAAAFFSRLGIGLPGGAPLGMLLFYLIGLASGAFLGVAVASWEPFYRVFLRKGMIVSIFYVEAVSLPLLAAGSLALRMNAGDAALWFGISFFMHLVYGLVLGIVMSYGLRD